MSLTLGTTLLLILPGLALLVWLLPNLEADWFEWLALSTGLSLALYPLLLLWLRLAGVQVDGIGVWILLGVCVALVLWRLVRGTTLRSTWRKTSPLFSMLLLVVVILAVVVRLLAVRGLDAPLWADGFQHTMIAQLIADHGGLFNSWLPYAPLESFTYHFGFHSSVAFLHWLTGVDIPKAVLIMGQVVNAAAAFTLYALVVRLTKNRWAGLVAVLVAALLSPLPAFYVNWGRYTQLAGQAILPVALWLTWEVVDHPGLNWRRLTVAAVAVAGLALTHYRVALFYVATLPAWLIVYILLDKSRRSHWLFSLGKLAVLGIVALLLITPWVLNVAPSYLMHQQVGIATTSDSNAFVNTQHNQLPDLRLLLSAQMLILAGTAFVVCLVRRWRLAAFIALWITFMFVLANPHWLHLPGTGVITNFAVCLWLYMPAAIVIGCGTVEVVKYVKTYWRWAPWAAGLLALAAVLWVVPVHTRIVKPEFVLVTPADVRAMDWIKNNTPAEARFLVNAFFAYGDSTAAGSDAGWWIPLLAKRESTVPPLTYTSEKPIDPDYPYQVNNLLALVEASDLSTPEGLEMLQQNGITYIYIGQKNGGVWDPDGPLLSADRLLAGSGLESVYHEDQVWVFKVKTAPLDK